tara:strand:+ start:1399 stop:1740 length:342 start_codon:yes stop_codon:yes gene_type:complete
LLATDHPLIVVGLQCPSRFKLEQEASRYHAALDAHNSLAGKVPPEELEGRYGVVIDAAERALITQAPKTLPDAVAAIGAALMLLGLDDEGLPMTKDQATARKLLEGARKAILN